ncbi:NTPase [Thermodesulfovibrio yellowstonii]|uniref:Nucleoside-triphosphatase THEP1 n=1 Tax=Thermodesulfovibrio yellowstonii TaxID=28262 RepID=A0A9W6GEB2_9BACT|nr:NTPase [Thermodesulfovibrio islandicus]GLI53723.1 nucleoside-triphosphatase THEP1 [Thermodesulfovibrio islandicus]
MKIFLTGKPGIGKTTVVKKIVSLLKDKAIGFWTEEFRDIENNKRLGFKVITTEGKTTTLTSKSLNSPFRVGSYGVNIGEFEEIVIPLLENAIKQKDKIIIIDEIGKMELFSEKFIDLVKKIVLDEHYRVIATIPIKDVHPLVASIRKLEGNLIEITEEDRDNISNYIYSLLVKT